MRSLGLQFVYVWAVTSEAEAKRVVAAAVVENFIVKRFTGKFSHSRLCSLRRLVKRIYQTVQVR